MGVGSLFLLVLSSAATLVTGNAEDPNMSWDATLVNPCTWFHITCNSNNQVSRLELYSNSFTGESPAETGELISLISWDPSQNQFSGPIPGVLEDHDNKEQNELKNSLTGRVPYKISRVALMKVSQSPPLYKTLELDGIANISIKYKEQFVWHWFGVLLERMQSASTMCVYVRIF
ncbi:hypothetical protein Cgig2_028536 [Carnegiea gigantea]|uniref:Leucine-rich repeat-containing N-terminal plant-type domain-containing protein n=1 Tax=Carnegiea gigantea TaxID=171969 RepID=A0A9Q1JWB5_9CARY|nr:hypothetical protein Cgig2_028536 [Carnegiea gigantea]